MSVITTKSSRLSILRVGGGRPSTNRVRFKLPNNIKRIFLDFKQNNNIKEYENLVVTIRDSEISDSDLLQLLREAMKCISVLSCDLRLFVQALILIRWTHRGDDVIQCYQEFINDLVSAHSQHTKTVIDQLIKLFILTEESDWIEGQPTEFQVKQFMAIHKILKSVVDTIPMSEKLLLESMRHHYPYMKVAAYKQQSYLYNMCRIWEYRSSLRQPMLQIMVDKLISIDVLAPREDILQAEEEPSGMFDMEVDDVDKQTCGMKHFLGDVLDLSMEQVLKFLEDETRDPARCRQVYKELLTSFDNVIVRTCASHHVQFLLFYVCGCDKTLAMDFLRHLWKLVLNVSAPTVLRQVYAAYLASFLARAVYIPLGYLKVYLNKMNQWIHTYIGKQDSEGQMRHNPRSHVMFCTICSAFFYLIAFRHKDLVDSKKKLVFLQSLNLSKIVTCKLNPLKVCPPAVAETFAAVTKAYQLAYCYTIIDKNNRYSMPVVDTGCSSTSSTTHLDLYFPFDTYVLRRTSKYIHPLYRDYEPVVQDDAGEDEDEEDELEGGEDGDEDEDDFIREQCVTAQGEASSPNSVLRFQCTNNLSCSPGFTQHMNMSL